MSSIETERGSHDEGETSMKIFAGWMAWEEISLLNNLEIFLQIPGEKSSNQATDKIRFPKLPIRSNFLASPQLALPRKSTDGVNNFFNWQRSGA